MTGRVRDGRRIEWPHGKRFAFTVFDDPDGQSLAASERVYGFLADSGFLTSKAVWPVGPVREANSGGDTCALEPFRRHAVALRQSGFEIAYHLAAPHSSPRDETIQALDRFKEYFGAAPASMANHYNREALYWGANRLTAMPQLAYRVATLDRGRRRFTGHIEGDQYFWGDVCRAQISYCRNFVFRDINALRVCPEMPYHDPLRPWVNHWFVSTEGDHRPAFVSAISEREQDRLEQEGGACIMYTHFGHGFVEGQGLHQQFRELMTRLSKKNGWFVPVNVLLDYLRAQPGAGGELDSSARSRLEWTWLREKLVHGTS
jgi:hypothetical protein